MRKVERQVTCNASPVCMPGILWPRLANCHPLLAPKVCRRLSKFHHHLHKVDRKLPCQLRHEKRLTLAADRQRRSRAAGSSWWPSSSTDTAPSGNAIGSRGRRGRGRLAAVAVVIARQIYLTSSCSPDASLRLRITSRRHLDARCALRL